MRGRHAAELTHTLARLLRSNLDGRHRRVVHLERQLASFDAGRRLASIRTRLVAADGRMRAAAFRVHDGASARFRHAAGQLDTLSPLAVLGRGYAVAWNADQTHVLRSAGQTRSGDRVHVTLARGELRCEVREAIEPEPENPRT